jgi:replicative DNA helicase
MIEKELIRLILNYNFYENNKHLILKEMFPSNLQQLYSTICDIHEKLKRDLSVTEIKAIYNSTYPTTTRAFWDSLNIILDNLPAEIQEDAAREVLKKAWLVERGRQIAEIGIGIVNGKEAQISKAKEIIENIEQGNLLIGNDIFEPISSELEDILEAINVTTKWHFNIEPLRIVAQGVGPGIFTIIYARPEVGKTGAIVSLMAAPDGFADQGANCCYFGNEEPPQRTQGRAVMSWTGMTLQEILLHPEEAKAEYAKIRERMKFFDCRGKDISEIEAFVSKQKPDIVAIDQLDKVGIKGTYAREDQEKGALYVAARDIGQKNETAMFALSQANADVEGKTYMGNANMAGARTSKSAEADLAIGIGKSAIHDDATRVLNISKNKINGDHRDVICVLKGEISRYVA